MSNIVRRKDSNKYFWGFNGLSKVFLGEIIELQNVQFCSFVKFASNVLNSHDHRTVFLHFSFPAKYFMILRNFNMFASSAANLVSGKRAP